MTDRGETATSARRLLVIEDGDEYVQFAELFLGDAFCVLAAQSAREALDTVVREHPDALLIDLRFDRAPAEQLVGDADDAAERLFGGDRNRALQWLKDQQGTLILERLREAGCDAPAVFVHEFSARRLRNLRRLYGRVDAVPEFDARRLREVLEGAS